MAVSVEHIIGIIHPLYEGSIVRVLLERRESDYICEYLAIRLLLDDRRTESAEDRISHVGADLLCGYPDLSVYDDGLA